MDIQRNKGTASVEQLVLLFAVVLGAASLLVALGPTLEGRHQTLMLLLSLPFP
ncbi:MAG: hypothetical protein M0R76_07120 [Proteobacteria bacterium]|nr:hypothetical protein [Pseudomonadota bacterium]NLN63143.1 hypothetical protein [Myxococcales bacterium]